MSTLFSNISAAAVDLISIPFSEKFARMQFSICNLFTAITWMPFSPGSLPVPLTEKLRIVTSPSGALIIKPVVPLDKTEPITPLPSMVIDLVIVSVPKPPGSRRLISPPAAVLLIAPARVLHGAVRLQGFTSSPTPETQVRVACPKQQETVQKVIINKTGFRNVLPFISHVLVRTGIFP